MLLKTNCLVSYEVKKKNQKSQLEKDNKYTEVIVYKCLKIKKY